MHFLKKHAVRERKWIVGSHFTWKFYNNRTYWLMSSRSMNPTHYTGCFIMYSRITKIYYRKTVGHVFMKPVQKEGTTENFFFPVSCFFNHSSHFCCLAMHMYVVRKWPLQGRSHFLCWNITWVSLWLLYDMHFLQSTQGPAYRQDHSCMV
jgi:hypothetical protein